MKWNGCVSWQFPNTNRESRCRTRHIHLGWTNCKQDDLKQSAVWHGIVLLFSLSFRDTQRAGEYLSRTSVWTRVYPKVSSTQQELVDIFNRIMRTGNGFNKVIMYILPSRQEREILFEATRTCVWLKLDVCSMCVRFATQQRDTSGLIYHRTS